MARQFSSAQITRALERHGFVFVSQRGSHMKFKSRGGTARTVIVPAGRKSLPVGTLKAIARQAGLRLEEL
ncbi:MAG: type II toxin-antitoxin system HicA family toxin [Actinomycetes bacterium]